MLMGIIELSEFKFDFDVSTRFYLILVTDWLWSLNPCSFLEARWTHLKKKKFVTIVVESLDHCWTHASL